MDIYQILIVAFCLLNLLTFIIYGLDKLKARRGSWRIPEFTLLALAAVGGSFGALAGMKIFHHKTLHRKFRYGVPLIIVCQVAVALYFFNTYA